MRVAWFVESMKTENWKLFCHFSNVPSPTWRSKYCLTTVFIYSVRNSSGSDCSLISHFMLSLLLPLLIRWTLICLASEITFRWSCLKKTSPQNIHIRAILQQISRNLWRLKIVVREEVRDHKGWQLVGHECKDNSFLSVAVLKICYI